VPTAYRPETYFAVRAARFGADRRRNRADAAWLPHANLIGRTLVDLGERLLGRIPAVRAIYRGLKQVFETLFSGQGSSFRRVGLVEFPSPGMWSIVLISQRRAWRSPTSCPARKNTISVFLPCAPNRHRLLFLRAEEQIVEIDMSAEDAATLIMSAGVVQPGSDPQKKIAALAATANAARAGQCGFAAGRRRCSEVFRHSGMRHLAQARNDG